MSEPGSEYVPTRRQLREAQKALDAGDLVRAHELLYRLSDDDRRVLKELDRSMGGRATDAPPREP